MEYKKVILISLDTLRLDGIKYADIHSYKHSITDRIDSAVLDDFISKGCFFKKNYTVAPYTATSHAAYFTGLLPKNNGVYDHFNSKLKVDSIFTFAKKAGYETFFKTDFPLILGKYLNFLKDVDNYYIEETDKSFDDFVKSEKALGFFHFGNIHMPYGFHSTKISGDDFRKKVESLEHEYNLAPDLKDFHDFAVETFRTEEDLNLLYRYKNLIKLLSGKKEFETIMNLYAEGINYFNHSILNSFLLKVMKYADEENCLVILFSDHGESWNNHSYGHFNSSDDECLRVPLVLYGKGIPQKVVNSRTRAIDLMPTLNELLFKLDLCFDGESLKNHIFADVEQQDRDVFCGVWINDMSDIMHNVNTVINNDYIDISQSRPIKYAACYYYGNKKYIVSYKRFALNGGLGLEDYIQSSLYKYDEQEKIVPIEMSKEENQKLQDTIDSLNVTNALAESFVEDELKKYHRMLGYGV